MNKYLLREVFADDPAMLSVFEGQEQTAILKQLLDEKNAGEETALAPNKRKIGILKELLKLREEMLEAELVSLIEPLIPPLIPQFIPPPIKGEDGNDGYTPVKGVDYFDGEDGYTPTEEELTALIKPLIPTITEKPQKEVTIDEEKIIAKLIKKIIKDKSIDISNIRNADQFIFQGTKYKTHELMHGGGSSASSGVTIITVSGTIDDSNMTFTATSQPTLLNINGAFYQQTGGAITWTYLTGTITLSVPVGTGGSIYGLA